jgi:hypothetical protein
MKRLGSFVAAAVVGAAAMLPAALTAPASAAAAARHRAAPVVLDCVNAPHVRPGYYMLACGDGNNYLTGMRWRSWTARSASASGTDVANDCLPFCAAGHFHRYRAEIRLDRPVRWAGHSGRSHFTRITIMYPVGRPEGAPPVSSFPLP